MPGVPDSGDTAWMMTATALVLLMTPGLALFYGGMVRSKSVLNQMMMSVSAIGLIGVLWVLYGYSMSFGTSVGDSGLVGDPTQFAGLAGLTEGTYLPGTATSTGGTASVSARYVPSVSPASPANCVGSPTRPESPTLVPNDIE